MYITKRKARHFKEKTINWNCFRSKRSKENKNKKEMQSFDISYCTYWQGYCQFKVRTITKYYILAIYYRVTVYYIQYLQFPGVVHVVPIARNLQSVCMELGFAPETQKPQDYATSCSWITYLKIRTAAVFQYIYQKKTW